MTQARARERQKLKALLLRWQSGEIDERHVHEEAERIWAQGSPWPTLTEEDPQSIVAELACVLDILNAQWITVEDVPAMLSFLGTPAEEVVRGWTEWRSYLNGVDFVKRRRQLESNPYYVKSGLFA